MTQWKVKGLQCKKNSEHGVMVSCDYVQTKGATDKRDLVGLGLFAYPVLMSADVLLYG